MRGDLLPVPGGYDEQGQLSCDPKEIAKTWRVLPIGYWKGSSMSIVMDMIAAVLSGGRSTVGVGKLGSDEYGLSQIFLAMDATRIAGEDYLASAINEVVDNVHGSVRVDPNQPVLYPGERSMGYRKDNLAKGIPVSDEVWAKIKSL